MFPEPHRGHVFTQTPDRSNLSGRTGVITSKLFERRDEMETAVFERVFGPLTFLFHEEDDTARVPDGTVAPAS